MAKKLYVGGDINAAANFIGTAATASTSPTTGAVRTAGGLGVALAINSGGAIATIDATESNSTATGSIITNGGVGLAKNLYVGGVGNIGSTAESTSVSVGSFTTAGGAGIAKNAFVGGDLTVIATTASTNSTTGAIQTAGGLGVALGAYIGGELHCTDATNAINATSGAIQTTGGIGVAQDVYSGGNVYATSFFPVSDVSLKTDVASIPEEEAIRVVSNIEPVTFSWKKDGTRSAGVIAQQVNAVNPLLTVLDSVGLMRVDYDKISVYNTKCIQALMRKMEAVDRELEELRPFKQTKLT